MYAVYDLKENEMCVGIFDCGKEVAEYFNTTQNSIFSTISHKQLKEHRYEIVRIEE